MNKKIFGRKLSRSRPAREALFSSLSRSLILSGKMITTRAKAKAVQGEVERLVTLAKKGSVSARRTMLSRLDNDRQASDLLSKKVAPIFTRVSGFTRIITLPRRRGDNAQMVRLEWTEKIVNSEKPIVNNKKVKKVKIEKEIKVNKKK